MAKQLDLNGYGLVEGKDGVVGSKPFSPSVTAEQVGKIGTVKHAIIHDVVERTFEGEQKVMLTLTIPDLVESEEGACRGFGLNKTNLISLVNAYGSNLELWLNKAVELRVEKTQYMGKAVNCLRLYAAD